jgi:hypothetical protein
MDCSLEKRTGRYRKNEEDKASFSINVRLYKEEYDRFKFMPGETDADRMRFLLENIHPFTQTIKRQTKKLSEIIQVCYRRAKRCTNPEYIGNNEEKKKEAIKNFEKSIREFEAYIDLFSFDSKTLNDFLLVEDLRRLSVILDHKVLLLVNNKRTSRWS